MSRRLSIQPDWGWPGSKNVYYVHALWAIALGAFLIIAPAWCYGASWSYFATHGQPLFPAGGLGLGICAATLGALQVVAILVGRVRATIFLLYMGGFVQWTAGIIFIAEGLLGHQGLMEAPYMLTLGALKFGQSLKLSVDYRRLHGGGR